MTQAILIASGIIANFIVAYPYMFACEWYGDGADGTPMTGRGWAVVEDDQLTGMICIHLGDESEFKATSMTSKKKRKLRGLE